VQRQRGRALVLTRNGWNPPEVGVCSIAGAARPDAATAGGVKRSGVAVVQFRIRIAPKIQTADGASLSCGRMLEWYLDEYDTSKFNVSRF
jgi:hypothetical protein